MKRNIKNDKIIKAMTIGLAAMIASTSAPVNVFAGEADEDSSAVEDTVEETSESSDSSESGSSSEESAPTAESVTADVTESVAATFAEAGSEITDSTSDIAAADAAVEALLGLATTDAYTAAVIDKDLADAQTEVDSASTDLGNAKQQITDALVGQAVANLAADQSIKTLESDLAAVDTAADTVSANKTELSANANLAANSNNAAEAAKAQYDAEQNVKNIENAADEAAKAVEKAADDAKKAQEDLDNANKAYEDALKEVDAAKKLLDSAGANASNASEKLADAKAKAEKLRREAEQNKADLEKIEDQYYATMVQYFRSIENAKYAVYDAEGHLDMNASASALKAAGKVDAAAAKPGNETFMLGRDLLRKIVTYMVKNDANVDWENAEFSFGEEGTFQDAYEGKVFESGTQYKTADGRICYVDQVVVNKERGHRDQSRIAPNENSGYKFYSRNTMNDNGRTNRVKVTYKDASGQLQTEYYNYVFKNSEEAGDLNDGAVFVALVKENSGVLTLDKDTTDLDSMQNLKDVIKAVANFDKYDKAVDAVKEAEREVTELEEAIKKLNSIGVDAGYLGQLKGRLDTALGNLEAAQAKADELAEELTSAQEVLAGIDLSRFVENTEAASDETSSSSAATAEAAAPAAAVAGGTTFAAPAAGTVDTALSFDEIMANGVAGVRANIGSEAAAPVANVKVPTVFANKKAAPKKENGVAGVRILKDELVPLAATPFEEGSENISWYWLLIIAALGATGRAMYENHMKKENADA